MSHSKKAPLAILIIIVFFAFTYALKIHWIKRQDLSKRRFESVVKSLENSKNKEWCDDRQSTQRLFVAQVMDRFGPEIRALWQKRKLGGVPEGRLLPLGPVTLVVKARSKYEADFGRTSWNWIDTYQQLQLTQNGGEEDLWYQIDTAATYLLTRDMERIVGRKKMLPPDQAEHIFQPNPAVKRVSAKEFRVELDPKDFSGHEREVAKIIEQEWHGPKFRVRVDWVPGKSGAFRLLANLDSAKSFVYRPDRMVKIANYSSTRSLAHEIGHVLGFDDHYYNVWHEKYCYYSQEYRTSDLMSDSDSGVVTARHWELLDKAYPWGKPALEKSFVYAYGPVEQAAKKR